VYADLRCASTVCAPFDLRQVFGWVAPIRRCRWGAILPQPTNAETIPAYLAGYLDSLMQCQVFARFKPFSRHAPSCEGLVHRAFEDWQMLLAAFDNPPYCEFSIWRASCAFNFGNTLFDVRAAAYFDKI
jgi:hypothetical protein